MTKSTVDSGYTISSGVQVVFSEILEASPLIN